MKKILFSIFMVAVIAVAAGWNVSRNMNEKALSDVTLANVEALASETNRDCKLSLLYICTSGNSDHYLYRSVN